MNIPDAASISTHTTSSTTSLQPTPQPPQDPQQQQQLPHHHQQQPSLLGNVNVVNASATGEVPHSAGEGTAAPSLPPNAVAVDSQPQPQPQRLLPPAGYNMYGYGNNSGRHTPVPVPSGVYPPILPGQPPQQPQQQGGGDPSAGGGGGEGSSQQQSQSQHPPQPPPHEMMVSPPPQSVSSYGHTTVLQPHHPILYHHHHPGHPPPVPPGYYAALPPGMMMAAPPGIQMHPSYHHAAVAAAAAAAVDDPTNPQYPHHHLVQQQHNYAKFNNMNHSMINNNNNGNDGNMYDIYGNKKGRWNLDEKILFLYGLRKFGKGRWRKLRVYLPKRSLVQIKSHAQKVLKRQKEGENVFRRLDENPERTEQLTAQVHELLGGEPPATLAVTMPSVSRSSHNNSKKASRVSTGSSASPKNSSSSITATSTTTEASIQTDPYDPNLNDGYLNYHPNNILQVPVLDTATGNPILATLPATLPLNKNDVGVVEIPADAAISSTAINNNNAAPGRDKAAASTLSSLKEEET